MKLLLAAIVQHLHQNDAYIRWLTRENNNLDGSMDMDGIEPPHATLLFRSIVVFTFPPHNFFSFTIGIEVTNSMIHSHPIFCYLLQLSIIVIC